MRIFTDSVEAAKEIERDLIEMGIENHPSTMQDIYVLDDENYKTKELMGYSYLIHQPNDTIQEWIRYFNLNIDWIEAEFHERIDTRGVNPGKAWLIRREVWEPFLHHGKFAYTYSERIGYQIEKAIQELKDKPGTRQAVITVYQGILDHENLGGHKRVPCSMHYQLLRRKVNGEDTLSIIYSMRSCDYYLHYPYDVVLACLLLKYASLQVGCKEGFFQHNIGSLHAYAKDYLKKGVF